MPTTTLSLPFSSITVRSHYLSLPHTYTTIIVNLLHIHITPLSTSPSTSTPIPLPVSTTAPTPTPRKRSPQTRNNGSQVERSRQDPQPIVSTSATASHLPNALDSSVTTPAATDTPGWVGLMHGIGPITSFARRQPAIEYGSILGSPNKTGKSNRTHLVYDTSHFHALRRMHPSISCQRR